MLYATLQQEKCLYLRFGGSELLERVHPHWWRAQGKSGVTEHDWGRKGGVSFPDFHSQALLVSS